MIASWKDFLIKHGAVVDDDRVSHFGNFSSEIETTRDATILCDLSQFGIIQIEGTDAQRFLHGQLSNNVMQLSPGSFQYTTYCSPKGRMLAGGLLFRSGSKYWLQLPKSIIPSIIKRLTMYILRSDVKLYDESEALVILGLSGTGVGNSLKHELGSTLPSKQGIIEIESSYVTLLEPNRYQIVLTSEQAPKWWERLAHHAKPVGSSCWDWMLIRSGIVTITPPTQDQFVPQMVNFEIIGGVNFEKGCYPGQEIIARAKYLGKLNRRAYLAHFCSDTSPQAGDELFSSDRGGQPCGAIINAAPAPGGGFDLLASIFIASAQSSSLHWKSLEGPEIKLLPLPYPLN